MYVSINIHGEAIARLDQLPARLHAAIKAKMEQLVAQTYDEVLENVSGRVVQMKTGALAESIEKGVTQTGSLIVGFVAPEPADEKARTLEMGGKGYYPIYPTKANLLSFYWELLGKRVALRYVYHPPLEARPYLAPAFAAIAAKMEPEFQAIIQGVLNA